MTLTICLHFIHKFFSNAVIDFAGIYSDIGFFEQRVVSLVVVGIVCEREINKHPKSLCIILGKIMKKQLIELFIGTKCSFFAHTYKNSDVGCGVIMCYRLQ